MEKIIVAATQNNHKIREIEAITKKFGMTIISRNEAGIPDIEIVEDGETFEENSYKKAYEIYPSEFKKTEILQDRKELERLIKSYGRKPL